MSYCEITICEVLCRFNVWPVWFQKRKAKPKDIVHLNLDDAAGGI